MEEKVFRLPVVAGILNESYVEARLHTDGETNIDEIRTLQETLVHSVATPYYVVVDPNSGEKKAIFEGATLKDESPFTEFLQGALAP